MARIARPPARTRSTLRRTSRLAASALAVALAAVVPAQAAAADSGPACEAVFDPAGVEWTSGFYIGLTITNTGDVPVQGYRVAWNFSGDQLLSSLPILQWTQSGRSVTATTPAWLVHGGRSLPPGHRLQTVATGSKPSGGSVHPLLDVTCTPL